MTKIGELPPQADERTRHRFETLMENCKHCDLTPVVRQRIVAALMKEQENLRRINEVLHGARFDLSGIFTP